MVACAAFLVSSQLREKKRGGAGSTSNDGKMHPEPAGWVLIDRDLE